ncbi:MAG: M4 family metallopeptidase [Acidobacteriota bacterium]
MRKALTAFLVLTMASGAFAAVQQAPRHEQERIFSGMELSLASFDERGVPTFLAGNLGRVSGGDPVGASLAFLEEKRAVFLATGQEEFAFNRVQEDELGQIHVRFQQTFQGRPVVGAELIVHLEAASGKVLAINGKFVPASEVPTQPLLEAKTALQAAAPAAGIASGTVVTTPELVYVPTDEGLRLAWQATVAYEKDGEPYLDRVYADSDTGEFLGAEGLLHRALYRKIYTANNGTSLPGTLMFVEGGSSSDTTAMAAYNNSGITYNYYKTKFNRDSYDNAGAQLISTVHYGSNYNNAFWNGSQMVYGDGDGTTFGPFAKALDVVAHELTHAVTDRTAGLAYQNDSGALNEAMSDIFGAATEAYSAGGISSNTWKIGEACYTPATAGDALRYMNNPTADGYSKDYYPERLYAYNCTPSSSNDYCGVHGNSGIANLAFYLMVSGGSHPRAKTSIAVTSIGLSRAEQIFYRALTVYLTSSSTYVGARNATAQAATDLYGSTYATYVHQAWDAVGVPGGPVNMNETESNGSLSTANTISTNGTNLKGFVGSSTDNDYFKIGVPAGKTLVVFMTPPSSQDYELYLYNSSGTTLVSSTYGTGVREQVIWKNTGTATAYVYARVYGYSGAYSTTSPYYLKVIW